ncbi:septum formation family protein [Agromyces laixinhei]|uniref:septum formation family protein n=1 Tax=Agromyces laixinhei TaxID=2585717 RepID=UPI001116944B|nr:septum formation family protein [Agromyces laixinhei]
MAAPASTATRRTLMRALTCLAAAAVVIPLSGCGVVRDLVGGSASQPARDETTQEFIEQGDADVFALMVGDCMNEVSEELVSEVPVVPCDQPHDEEVYFDLTLDGDEFPGEEAVQTRADEACLAQFEPFVGLAYDSSTLGFYAYRPSQESWERAEDRVVSCVIYDPAGKVTGTLAGSAR